MRKKKSKIKIANSQKVDKKVRSSGAKPAGNSNGPSLFIEPWQVPNKKSEENDLKPPLLPIHPWRICPYGEHWVRTHPLHVPPSEKNPEGSITTRHQHCAGNPSGKDQFYPEEIGEIAKNNFSDLKNVPCSLNLGFGAKGSEYDSLIAGWVQYWNDVLKPNDPLDPNLVKALIATESGFKPDQLANKKDSNSA